MIFWCTGWTLICWLNHWSLEIRFTEDCTTCTLHHAWWALFSWLQTAFITDFFASFRSLHVLYRLWHWSTESMSRGSAKIYMHCTHTTAHSMTLSSTLTAWLKSQIKRLTESTLDWLGLLTVSCVGERSSNFSVCCLSISSFIFLFKQNAWNAASQEQALKPRILTPAHHYPLIHTEPGSMLLKYVQWRFLQALKSIRKFWRPIHYLQTVLSIFPGIIYYRHIWHFIFQPRHSSA